MIARIPHSPMTLLRTRAWRPAGMALMGLLAAALALGEWHVSSGNHSVCLEHGELVEGAACHVATAADPHAGGPTQPLPAVDVAPSIDVVDGHHHCAVLGVLHHSAPRASAPALEPSRLEVLAELVGPCLPVRAAKVPVFRLAPKQSPPAA